MGTAFLNNLSVISTNDCCTLLLTCLEKAFHVGSVTFTTENFKYMMCLKNFSLQKSIFLYNYQNYFIYKEICSNYENVNNTSANEGK